MALRQLKNRIIRQRMQKETAYRTETRDAILWDVIDNKRCRVKILGSNTLLVANYPENLESKPAWLKPGTAVKINHTAGNRHTLTVIGLGTAIPQPTDSSLLPTPPIGVDAVLAGLELFPFETPGMFVYVSTGTFRIGGTIYTVEPSLMSESNLLSMNSGAPLDTTAEAVAISAAHSTLYRLDLIVVGADMVIHTTNGTAAATPVEPAVPVGHLRLGNVLVPPGVTTILQSHLNRTFSNPIASQLTLTISDSDLAWGENSCTITAKVLDQYGRIITGTNWGVYAEFLSGTGTIDGQTTSTRYTGTSSNQAIFIYARNTAAGEKSPMLQFSLIQNPNLKMIQFITVRDTSGNILMG